MYGKVDYDPLTDAHKCEECPNRWFRALVRHITRHHRMTIRDYKIKWGIEMRESLMGESVRTKLRQAVLNSGAFVNLELGRNHRFKKGERTTQYYRRSEQTKRRLRVLRMLTKHRLKFKKK